MAEWRFYIETFGCRVNQEESQEIRDAWVALGGQETARPSDADWILINSCAITSHAEREARNSVYKLRRQAPDARIILTGCSAQLFESFKPRKGAYHAVPDLCVPQVNKQDLLGGPWRGPKAESAGPSILHRTRPVLKVQDGCSHGCTYCIVPRTRPVLASLSPAQAATRCREYFANGVAEIVISGINLAQYGQDKPEYGDFWELVRGLDGLLAPENAGKARLRLSSVEPSMLTPRALEVLANTRLVCHHLHLSLQHASRDILRKMGRGHYRIESVIDFLNELRSIWPNLGLGADLLVGFPGESEQDLAILVQALDETRLTYAHVFPYSPRPGAPAAAFGNQVPQAQKRQRARLVREKARQLKLEFLQSQLLVPELEVIWDRQAGTEAMTGIAGNYVPCVCHSPAHCGGICRCTPVGLAGEQLEVRRLDPL